MKISLLILMVATFIACHTKKTVPNSDKPQQAKYLKSELYFENCDSLKSFLKVITVTNRSDTKLNEGYFRIPFIVGSYDYLENLFPEKCFVGMPADELYSIFGKGILEGDYATYYILKSKGNRLGFEVWTRDEFVTKFKVRQASINVITPTEKQKK
jgi:hypothetical protein